MNFYISTVHSQALFRGVIVKKATDVFAKGVEIVGDFLPIVATRADKAGSIYIY
jgi:hypothetical protein